MKVVVEERERQREREREIGRGKWGKLVPQRMKKTNFFLLDLYLWYDNFHHVLRGILTGETYFYGFFITLFFLFISINEIGVLQFAACE